ncbi:uncharacterized protein LOC135209103 [Macrobrachium nipponense]|uniref:uncharacterized protein LOC135209103 n=1 Tax=Macrobrachium nipponense TaxID=159736 RepID=UPI0030C7E6A1
MTANVATDLPMPHSGLPHCPFGSPCPTTLQVTSGQHTDTVSAPGSPIRHTHSPALGNPNQLSPPLPTVLCAQLASTLPQWANPLTQVQPVFPLSPCPGGTTLIPISPAPWQPNPLPHRAQIAQLTSSSSQPDSTLSAHTACLPTGLPTVPIPHAPNLSHQHPLAPVTHLSNPMCPVPWQPNPHPNLAQPASPLSLLPGSKNCLSTNPPSPTHLAAKPSFTPPLPAAAQHTSSQPISQLSTSPHPSQPTRLLTAQHTNGPTCLPTILVPCRAQLASPPSPPPYWPNPPPQCPRAPAIQPASPPPSLPGGPTYLPTYPCLGSPTHLPTILVPRQPKPPPHHPQRSNPPSTVPSSGGATPLLRGNIDSLHEYSEEALNALQLVVSWRSSLPPPMNNIFVGVSSVYVIFKHKVENVRAQKRDEFVMLFHAM